MRNLSRDFELLLHGAGSHRHFNHAANASPRSGSTKRVTLGVWCVIAVVVIVVWFGMQP